MQVSCDMTMTAMIAAVLLLVGFSIRGKYGFFTSYCIPAPAIGCFLFMFVTLAGYETGTFSFKLDTTLREPFMIAFFTTVGLGASMSLLRKGGLLLIVYWLCASVVSIIQNFISVGLASVTGLEYPYALLAGAISMIGGHGSAEPYGATFVKMGYTAGRTVGSASATLGLIFAILVGGPVARLLIERHKLKPDMSETRDVFSNNASQYEKLSHLDVMKNVTAILACMAIGAQFSKWIGSVISLGFPPYLGALFAAVIARNLNEKFGWYRFSFRLVDSIGDVMLNLYLAMALMDLSLYQLFNLIGPVLLIVAVQVIVLVILCYFVIFRVLGSNYDAAMMCAGMLGHGLGATPTAIVNMTAVRERYGMSRKAFMIVPIVGAFLVDIIYQPQTVAFIKFFVRGFSGQ